MMGNIFFAVECLQIQPIHVCQSLLLFTGLLVGWVNG
jgi:hypothetical protein